MIITLAVIASGLFYLTANRDLEGATYKAHFQTLRNTMQMLLPWLILVNLIGLAVVITLALFFTHRISGPAYHLIKDLHRVADGDLTVATRFRKRDRLKDVGNAMTEAVGHLRENVIDIKKGLEKLARVAESHPEVKQELGEISKVIDKLKT